MKEWAFERNKMKHLAKYFIKQEKEKTKLYYLKEFKRNSKSSFEYFEKHLEAVSWKIVLKWREAKRESAFYAF